MSTSHKPENTTMLKSRRRIIFHLIVLCIFTKTDCRKIKTETCVNNSCCYNFYQSSNGDCLECPSGTFGINCSGKCVKGFYGRFCASQCDCPAERCDVKFGCPKERADGNESTSAWINVTYALIGSTTTMSLIGLLFYHRSWFVKTNASSTVTNQLYTDRTEHQEEQGYESHRGSRETENVPPRTYDHPDVNDYTDLNFSKLHLYGNSSDCEGGQKPEALSVNTIPSQRDVHSHNHKEVEDNDDDDDEADREGAHEHFLEHEQYNVLSLRRAPLEKSMTLRSADFSSNLEDNTGEMHNEYDSIEMKEKNKEECAHGISKLKSELPDKEVCRESLIKETIKDYIETAQLDKERDMIIDNGASVLKAISKSKTFTVREFDRPKRFSMRPYSLANSSLRTRHTSEISSMSRVSDYEEVTPIQTDEENEMDDLKCSDHSIQSNIISFSDQKRGAMSDKIENKKLPMSSNSRKDERQEVYEEIESFENESQINTKGTDDRSELDSSVEYSQVMKRTGPRFEDSSTLSAEVFCDDNSSKLPSSDDKMSILADNPFL